MHINILGKQVEGAQIARWSSYGLAGCYALFLVIGINFLQQFEPALDAYHANQYPLLRGGAWLSLLFPPLTFPILLHDAPTLIPFFIVALCLLGIFFSKSVTNLQKWVSFVSALTMLMSYNSFLLNTWVWGSSIRHMNWWTSIHFVPVISMIAATAFPRKSILGPLTVVSVVNFVLSYFLFLSDT